MLLGAFQEAKRELVESRRQLIESKRKRDESEAKLHNTNLLLLQTRKELEESRSTPTKQMTLNHIGDYLTFCMYGYSLYKSTDKVWHSPPLYFGDGYKLCLAVYANGKGAGAGTHVSVELLQMKGEDDDKLTWNEGPLYFVRDTHSLKGTTHLNGLQWWFASPTTSSVRSTCETCSAMLDNICIHSFPPVATG